jgi:hypothetical protein
MEVALGRSPLTGLLPGGTVLVFLGLLGFAIPIFTAERTTDVANIGGLELQSTQSTSYVIPPLVSGGAMVLGVVLIAAGFYRRR